MTDIRQLRKANPSFKPEPMYQYFQIVRYIPAAIRKSQKPPPPKAEKRKRFWHRGQSDHSAEDVIPEQSHDWEAVTILYFDDKVMGHPQYSQHMSSTEMQATIEHLIDDGYQHTLLYKGTKKQVLYFQRKFQRVPSDFVKNYEIDDAVQRLEAQSLFIPEHDKEYCEIERQYPGEGEKWSGVAITYFDAKNHGKRNYTIELLLDAMDYRIQKIEEDGYRPVAVVRQFVDGLRFYEWLFFGRDYIGNSLNFDPQSRQHVHPIPETPFELDVGWDYCRVLWVQEEGEISLSFDYFDREIYHRAESRQNDLQINAKLLQEGWEYIELPRPSIPLPLTEQTTYYRRPKAL